MRLNSTDQSYCLIQHCGTNNKNSARSYTQNSLLPTNILGPVKHYFDRTCISPCLSEPTQIANREIPSFSWLYGFTTNLGAPVYQAEPCVCVCVMAGVGCFAGGSMLGLYLCGIAQDSIAYIKNQSPYTTYQMDRPTDPSVFYLRDIESLSPRIPERTVATINGAPDMRYQMDRFADIDSSDKVRTELLRARISG